MGSREMLRGREPRIGVRASAMKSICPRCSMSYRRVRSPRSRPQPPCRSCDAGHVVPSLRAATVDTWTTSVEQPTVVNTGVTNRGSAAVPETLAAASQDWCRILYLPSRMRGQNLPRGSGGRAEASRWFQPSTSNHVGPGIDRRFPHSHHSKQPLRVAPSASIMLPGLSFDAVL